MQSSRRRFVSLVKVRTKGSDTISKVNDVLMIGIISFDIQIRSVISFLCYWLSGVMDYDILVSVDMITGR